MSQLKNFKIVFSSVILGWGISVFIRFLMPRTLGPQILGEYGTAEAWAAMLGTVANWGFSSWVSVHFSSQREHKNAEATAVLHAQFLQSICSYLVAIIVIFASGSLSGSVLLISILALSAVTTPLAEASSRIIEAQGNFDEVAKIANRVRVTFGGSSVITLALAFSGILSPKTAAIAVATSTFMGEGCRAFLTTHRAKIAIFKKPDAPLIGQIFRDSAMLFVLGATPIVFSRVPQIILSHFPSTGSILPNTASELGILAASLSLTIPLGVLVLGIQRVLVPSFARAKEIGPEKFSEVFANGSVLVLALAGLGSAGLIICGNPIVEILFGQKFLAARAVLRITLLTAVVQYASLLLVSSAVAWRRERTAAFGAFLAFPFNVASIFVFLKTGTFSTGAEGVAWATLLYEAIIVLVVFQKMSCIFPIQKSVVWAFLFALSISAVAFILSAVSSQASLQAQIGLATASGLAFIGITLLIFAKKARTIAKSWQA